MKILYAFLLSVLLLGSAQADQATLDKLQPILERAKTRSPILTGLHVDTRLQLLLPRQYPACLYASSLSANHKNEAAHAFILKQIDLMTDAGMGTGDVRGLVGFGHGEFLATLGNRQGELVDKLGAGQIQAMVDFAQERFVTLRCAETFEDERVATSIQTIIREAIRER